MIDVTESAIQANLQKLPSLPRTESQAIGWRYGLVRRGRSIAK
jgi:hypothetical protein